MDIHTEWEVMSFVNRVYDLWKAAVKSIVNMLLNDAETKTSESRKSS